MPEPLSDQSGTPASERPTLDEPPPFLGRWSRVYAGVLIYLAAAVLLLTAITRLFHYD